MPILTKYIAKITLKNLLLLSCIFCIVLALISLTTESHHINGTHNYRLPQAISYVMLQLPKIYAQISPIVVLIAVIITLGMLIYSNELVIMRASGYSTWQIIQPITAISIIFSGVIILSEQYFIPQLFTLAKQQKIMQRSNGQVLKNNTGIWTRHNNEYLNIKPTDIDHKYQITKYTLGPDSNLISIDTTKDVYFINGIWQANNITQITISANSVRKNNITQQNWPINIDADYIKYEKHSAAGMTITQLWNYVHKFSDPNQIADKTSLELWYKLMQPIVTLMMLFLTIPIILTSTQSKLDIGLRIMLCLLVGILFLFIVKTFGLLSITMQIQPLIALNIPIICTILILGIFLRKHYI